MTCDFVINVQPLQIPNSGLDLWMTSMQSELRRGDRAQAGDTHKIRMTLSGFKALQEAKKFLHRLMRSEHLGFIQDVRDEGGGVMADITVCCFDMDKPDCVVRSLRSPSMYRNWKGCPT